MRIKVGLLYHLKRRGSQVVRPESAKLLYVGSIPTRASIFSPSPIFNDSELQLLTGCFKGLKSLVTRQDSPVLCFHQKVVQEDSWAQITETLAYQKHRRIP